MAADLKELGVTALGHRRKLLAAIAALRDNASGKVPSLDAATTPSAPSAQPEDTDRARAPPSHGDVLRLGRLNSAVGPHGP